MDFRFASYIAQRAQTVLVPKPRSKSRSKRVRKHKVMPVTVDSRTYNVYNNKAGHLHVPKAVLAKFRDEQKKKAVAEEKKARAVEEKKEVAQLRVRQRQEIYALNQVMKELEERRFQQYVKEKTES